MNHLEELIRIQQEYEYFTKESREIADNKAYALLKKNPVFQSSYIKHVFELCDKRRSMERISRMKRKFSQKIFWGMILCFVLTTITLILI